MLGAESQEVLKIARSSKTADDRMRDISRIDQRFFGWKSPQWSNLIKVSAAAIRKTKFWKEDRQQAIEQDRNLRD